MNKLIKFLVNNRDTRIALVTILIMCVFWFLVVAGFCVVARYTITDGAPLSFGKIITLVTVLVLVDLGFCECLTRIDAIVREIKIPSNNTK